MLSGKTLAVCGIEGDEFDFAAAEIGSKPLRGLRKSSKFSLIIN
jgi:hypothetical protein